MTSDFDYKKYSLEQLENWIHDALSSAEASPQEIYDVIKGVVEEQYYYFKVNTERCYELLALLNGNGKGHIEAYDKYVCDKDDTSPECKNAWNNFWEDTGVVEDKVKKWVLPVESDGPSGEYFVTFPEDLLKATNLNEGDQVDWVDQGDGSYLLRKVSKTVEMEDC
jgi:hypothetical protein